MQTNNNLSCLPFYTSLEEQDFRKWYAYGAKYIHRVPSDFLVPFYFVLPYAPSGEAWYIDKVRLYQHCCTDIPRDGNGSFNIAFSDAFERGESFLSILQANNLSIRDMGDGLEEVVYTAYPNTPLNLARGLYYINITIGCPGEDDREYFSDIFFVDSRENLEANSVKLEWWNIDNLEYEGGLVPYDASMTGSDRYKNVFYLDTEIGKPTYNFTEEGEERNGYFFPTKQISEKAYNMSFIAPEYLCDVMRLIRMADVAKITDRLGRVYNVEHFESDVDWLEQGYYAEVNCTFQTDTVIKKVGKAYII